MSNPIRSTSRTNVLAIVSLASSFVISIVAVVTGHIALAQVRRTGENGRELALAGVIIGYVGIAFGALVSIAAIVAVTVAAASGAFVSHRNVFTSPPTGPRATAAPAPSAPGVDPLPAQGDITFDEGQHLDAGIVPHISDGLLGDDAWKQTTPRAGGTWVYSSTDGYCTTTFHEGPLAAEVQVSEGDDLDTTDSYLAALTKSDIDDVSSYAQNDYLGLDQFETGAIVDTRRLAGSDAAGVPHITVARAFAALGQGVSIDIECSTRAEAVDAYDHVVEQTPLLVN
ncbi:hypothetical protein C5B96_14760 [Subtercola sp. Z020]|uniref:DUF4190 domain-containing protein n=1 Tax=Subtercola sp. Z020 TaxID=2080582 RepID=UPI000CE759CD|nr:DUF4190 domain-containing protein [Subtercola sp. Z020]PPF78255.1 hypothetical protein C5B96_14760 [Subtercola sp. Z020]